ncbi:hypothetical protein NOVOSPHI9U_310006 [Novosphingobium sp. 9U]|nr:hypothetical protein NOVOSPHI9U_310006 [Novosphingobium sp. 9U]
MAAELQRHRRVRALEMVAELFVGQMWLTLQEVEDLVHAGSFWSAGCEFGYHATAHVTRSAGAG